MSKEKTKTIPPLGEERVLCSDAAKIYGASSETVKSWAKKGVVSAEKNSRGARLVLPSELKAALIERPGVKSDFHPQGEKPSKPMVDGAVKKAEVGTGEGQGITPPKPGQHAELEPSKGNSSTSAKPEQYEKKPPQTRVKKGSEKRRKVTVESMMFHLKKMTPRDQLRFLLAANSEVEGLLK